MSEAPVTKRRRRGGRMCGPSPYDIDRLCDDRVPNYGVITYYSNDGNEYTVPPCKHGSSKDRCLRCRNLCEHDRGKASCLTCNRCDHNQHRKLCKYCNHWTCNVEGCLDKGHRLCSKGSLKHHTMCRCPRTDAKTWGGGAPRNLLGQPIAVNRSEPSAASESNVQ